MEYQALNQKYIRAAALILLISTCAIMADQDSQSVSRANGRPPDANSEFEETRTIPYSDLGVVVDNTYVWGAFEFKRDLPWISIWKSKSSESGGTTALYLPPMLVFDIDELRKALNDAVRRGPVSNSPASAPLYRMSWKAELFSKEMAEVAAKHLNSIQSSNNYNAEMFSPLPFRWLSVEAFLSEGRSLRLLPQIIQRYPGAVKPPTAAATLSATGTREELSEIVEQSTIRLDGEVKGFMLTQNIVSGSLEAFAQEGFSQDLVGDAIWKDLKSYNNGSGGLTASLGPISLGTKSGGGSARVSRDSWVTRNQVLSVSRRCSSKITVAGWLEQGTAYESRRDKLMDKIYSALLARFTSNYFAVDEQSGTIKDSRLLHDLDPDKITALNNEIKQKWNSKRQTKQTVSYGKAKVANSDNFDLLLDDDIGWDGDGEAIVPKSVRLHQVNQAAINDMAAMRFVTSDASRAGTVAETDAVFVETVPTETKLRMTKPLPFKISQMKWASGGDPDVATGDHATKLRMWHTTPLTIGDVIRLTVTCEVEEVPDNHTRLQGHAQIEIPKPPEFASLSGDFFSYAPPTYDRMRKRCAYSLEETIQGKVWGFVPIATDNRAIIHGLEIKPDGPGDDNHGNSQARGVVVLPYLEFPEGSSSTTLRYYVR